MMDRRLWREPSFDLMGKVFQINWLYVLLLCCLAGVGYVALYSAGGGSAEPYATRHAMRFAFGLVIMVTIGLIDIRVIAKLAWPAWFGGVALLVLVLRMGHIGKGAQRWLELGPLQIQPSELMKLALVLALASWFHKASWERMGNPLFLIPPLIAVLIPVGLILKEPNLGTAAITAMLGASIFFAAGVRWWKFLLVALPIPLLAQFVYTHLHDYQRARIDTFLHPESDPLGAGYNIIQSKIALGSGGMWGKGFLQGTQAHLDFLPEKQTDFIFATLAEEFGFVGCISILILYAAVIVVALRIASLSHSHFGRLSAAGVTATFALYVLINGAMVMGLAPVVGVPMPLLSFGGTVMLTVMVAFGLVQSVRVHRYTEVSRGAGALI